MVDEFGHALGLDALAVVEDALRLSFRKIRIEDLRGNLGVLRADLRDRFDADDDSRGDQRASDQNGLSGRHGLCSSLMMV